MEPNIEKSATPSARALHEHRQEILEAWMVRVRKEVKGAEKLRDVILINTAPAFLENLAEALAEEFPRLTASESSTISAEHGNERARLTAYGPEQLLKEYQILRETILDKLSEKVHLTKNDRSVIFKSIDKSVNEAMTSFFLMHSRIREQFIAGLSHDLRNPLAAAKLSGQMIQKLANGVQPEDLRSDFSMLANRLVNNIKRADRMIQDMLDASSLQIGERLPLKIRDAEMLSIIKDVLADLPQKEQQRVHIHGVTAQGQWDGEALRRAADNLVTNALKYGDPTKPITVKVRAENERVIVTVHNFGNPIPAEEQEGLFQSFRRSDSARKSGKPGWGIGLALVRGVAESHGGSIVLDSSLEGGTTFIIDVPADARPYQNAPIAGS